MARPRSPLYTSLSDAALLENYASLKALAYTAAAVKSARLGRILRDLDIVIAVSRKRGMSLPVTFGGK